MSRLEQPKRRESPGSTLGSSLTSSQDIADTYKKNKNKAHHKHDEQSVSSSSSSGGSASLLWEKFKPSSPASSPTTPSYVLRQHSDRFDKTDNYSGATNPALASTTVTPQVEETLPMIPKRKPSLDTRPVRLKHSNSSPATMSQRPACLRQSFRKERRYSSSIDPKLFRLVQESFPIPPVRRRSIDYGDEEYYSPITSTIKKETSANAPPPRKQTLAHTSTTRRMRSAPILGGSQRGDHGEEKGPGKWDQIPPSRKENLSSNRSRRSIHPSSAAITPSPTITPRILLSIDARPVTPSSSNHDDTTTPISSSRLREKGISLIEASRHRGLCYNSDILYTPDSDIEPLQRGDSKRSLINSKNISPNPNEAINRASLADLLPSAPLNISPPITKTNNSWVTTV